MTTVPATVPARQFAMQAVHYFRKVVNFNDANISDATKSNPFGALPINASIQDVQVDVVTAFNAVTTNVLTVGTTTANANEIVAAADVSEAGIADTDVSRARGTILTAAAQVNLYVKYTQTGTAATAGKAIITITFIPDNDG